MDSRVVTLTVGDEADLTKTVIKVGAEWCKPCKRSEPDYNKLSACYEMLNFYSIDVDKFEGSNQFSKTVKGITKLPTVLFYLDGIKVNEINGYDRTRVLAGIENYILIDDGVEDYSDIQKSLTAPKKSSKTGLELGTKKSSSVIEETPPIEPDGEDCDIDISKVISNFI